MSMRRVQSRLQALINIKPLYQLLFEQLHYLYPGLFWNPDFQRKEIFSLSRASMRKPDGIYSHRKCTRLHHSFSPLRRHGLLNESSKKPINQRVHDGNRSKKKEMELSWENEEERLAKVSYRLSTKHKDRTLEYVPMYMC
jgi:hypothetical protein